MSPRNYLEPEQWYATLSTVYASACALITDPDGRVLIVKPNYRPYWAIPGGIVEEGERPDQCAVRECTEELGVEPVLGALLVVDWAPPLGPRPKTMVSFTFDGGTLADPSTIRLQEDELDDFAFLPWDQAASRLPAITAPRIGAALRARKDRCTVYRPVNPG